MWSAVITHPEKLLFPEEEITKGELASYYEAIAPLLLPHVRGRPITMERHPAGIARPGFLQKDVSKGFPLTALQLWVFLIVGQSARRIVGRRGIHLHDDPSRSPPSQ